MIGGRFAAKVAVVTGGAGGIGFAIAQRLSDEGASVVIADRELERATGAADRLSAADPHRAIGVACDVGVEQDVEACVEAAIARFGRIDLIVNNAGLMTFKTLAEWTSADWLDVLRVDLVGAALFTKQAFLHMAQDGGAIVNIASIHALQTTANVAPYSAAKAAVLSLTRTSAIEGRDLGIRANAILPGAIDTPMLWDNPNVKSGAETIDKRDVGTPADISAAVAFLGSADASFISGTSLVVDGGRLAKL